MMEREETFDEACALVERELDPIRTNGWKEMIDRIRAAHEREVAKHERSYHALEVHCKQLEDAYLKATNALKPVLEFSEEACRSFGDHYLMLDNAVREAQRIAKEGGVK